MPDEPVGFDIDIGKILRDTGLTGTKRRRPSTTTADAAIRRAKSVAEIDNLRRRIDAVAAQIAATRAQPSGVLPKSCQARLLILSVSQ